MSQTQTNKESPLRGNWLSALALWVIIGAWAAAGIWGWNQNAAGVMAGIATALTIGCQVFAARAVKNAAEADGIGSKAGLIVLGAFCLVFTAWSGKQALATSEAQRWAPYEARQDAEAAVNAIDAKIDDLPTVPTSDTAGRPLGPQRMSILSAERSTETARLMGLREKAAASLAKIPAAPKPSAKAPEAFQWCVSGLIEALELFGFWAIAPKRRRNAPQSSEAKGSNVTTLDPSDLGRRLNGLRKDRQRS